MNNWGKLNRELNI